jgi:hypothetical protein
VADAIRLRVTLLTISSHLCCTPRAIGQLPERMFAACPGDFIRGAKAILARQRQLTG